MQTLAFVVAASAIAMATAHAAPMTFQHAGSTCMSVGCEFVLGEGEIVQDTPQQFERFLRENSNAAKVLRLSSGGGSLLAGLKLGEQIRAAGISTEIGSSRPAGDGSVTIGGSLGTKRIPGNCASACAYAFLGGIGRTIEAGSQIGLHRFYRESAIAQPTEKLFTGADLDSTQITTAAIVLYLARMGIDGRVVTIAAEAGPGEMRWLSEKEARDLRVIYEPEGWLPWRLDTYRGGALAVSETQDSKRKMIVGCSRRFGAFMSLTDDSMPRIREWFQQAAQCPADGFHPVLGLRVGNNRVSVSPSKVGATLTFWLPRNPDVSASPVLLSREGYAYPNACSAYSYTGSTIGFKETIAVAMKACVLD